MIRLAEQKNGSHRMQSRRLMKLRISCGRNTRRSEFLPLSAMAIRVVVEHIKVSLPDTHARSDADLAKPVADALRWDVQVPHSKIRTSVRDGRGYPRPGLSTVVARGVAR
jgi:hypothetical protein